MTGDASQLAMEQKQRELQERCRHPTGSQLPAGLDAPRESIPERIAAVTRAVPGRLAVVDHQTSLTYAELDRAANRVAHAVLEDRGPGEEVIALLVGVDAPAITAALGVLKAGKAYVALEASFPQQRSAHILTDAGVQLILADAAHLAQAQDLAGSGRRAIQLETLAAADPSSPDLPIPVHAPAILNYTSGSTGKPKGAVQSHRSTFLQAAGFASHYRFSDADRLAFGESLAWAACLWYIYGPLCLGGTSAPFDFRQHGLPRLLAWLEETEPTIVAGRMFIRHIVQSNPQARFPSVRVVAMGGDTIYREDAVGSMRAFPNALIDTGLGLSEAGRVTQLMLDSPEMVDWDVLPLGLPASGLQVRLLGDDEQEVAPGEVGEIVVAGPGLASGYWQRPDLTAAQFRIAGSMGPEPAYFSGDLGRQTPDGLIHYVGRKDHMVKIRGYQVFTNEIETLLREVEGVREACVTAPALPDNTRRLVAYLAVDRPSFPGVAALYAQFDDLPRHMAPQDYQFLDALPKTPTGKVDRGQLPVPIRSRLGVTATYAAARDPVEKTLTRIWSTVLGIEGVGIYDDFLELGGDSIDSMRISNQVMFAFGVEIPLTEFFRSTTIAGMAARIRGAG